MDPKDRNDETSSSSSSDDSDDSDSSNDSDDAPEPLIQNVDLSAIQVDRDKIPNTRIVSEQCVSQYELGAPIGCGTQAMIYSSKDGKVAIRIATLKKKKEAFLRDVQIRRVLEDCDLNAPFVRLLDVFICKNSFGVEVMPRADGNLMQLVHEKYENDNIVDTIMQKCVDGLKLLHQCRIVHRDIGFQNILFVFSGDEFDIMFTDFEDSAHITLEQTKSDRFMDQAFDGYRNSDILALQNMQQELRDLQTLFRAYYAKDKSTCTKLWQGFDSFVKKNLECSYPNIRQFLFTYGLSN